MKTARLSLVLVCGVAAHSVAFSESTQSDQLSDYLVDIGAGPVSAADLIGLSATAVTNVQNLKDLNVLFTPSTGSDQKTGSGIQITPGRTQWSPITASQYVNSDASRFLASISLSYAQNKSTYGGLNYKQQGFALHAAYYIDHHDDPIVAAHESFAKCEKLFDIEKKKAQKLMDVLKKTKDSLGRELTAEERAKAVEDYNSSPEFIKFSDDADLAVKKCVADGAREKWNAGLISVTLGGAWVRPDQGGQSHSLGQSLSLGAVVPASKEGAINLLARFSRREVDTDTLATSPTYHSHSLVAARYTYRGGEDSKLFGILEASNAKNSDATLSGALFKYAIGLDRKIMDSVWLEFRVGRARSANSTDDETKALFALKWSPTPSLPNLFSKQ